jgi:integrase
VRYREYRRLESGEVKGTQKCHRLCGAVQVYRSKSAAQQLANEFLKPFNDGTFSPDNAMGLDQFIENVYLPEIKATKRPSTYSGYVKIWSRYLKSRCPAPLRTFKTMACEQLLRDVQTEYDLSQTTLAHIKHFLSGTFRYAIRTGKIVQNPVRDVCLPGGKAPNETYAYSLDEISRMLRVVPHPANVIIAVAAFTGLRRGEIRGLKPEDYDGEYLHVRRSVWKKHVGDPKGKRGKGAVHVIAPLKVLLESYLERISPKNYVFQTLKGGPADLDYVSHKIIAPKLKESGIVWHGWHACRRGLATNLHELGVPDIVIQAILRHSEVSVTRNAYIKRSGVDKPSRDAMTALEQLVCNQSATLPLETPASVVVQ